MPHPSRIFILNIVYLLTYVLGSCSQAQEFQVEKIFVGQQPLTVEVAETKAQHAQGLMNRNNLPEGQGMLFVFDREQILNFWMKNTLVPLSIGFFDAQFRLFEIMDMNVVSLVDKQPPLYTSRKEGLLALEVPQGWFRRHKISLGSMLKVSSAEGSTTTSSTKKSPGSQLLHQHFRHVNRQQTPAKSRIKL